MLHFHRFTVVHCTCASFSVQLSTSRASRTRASRRRKFPAWTKVRLTLDRVSQFIDQCKLGLGRLIANCLPATFVASPSMARSSLISRRRPVINNMLSTKTTPPEEDLTALQWDIRLMEIADDPAQFRNFLPGHLRGNSTEGTYTYEVCDGRGSPK